jgi:hypothetical protein
MWNATAMKVGLSVLAAFSISAPATSDDRTFERLMDGIEKQVRLPEGAAPLQDYARHYASQTDGKVVGVYVLRAPAPARGPDWSCAKVVLDGGKVITKPVACPSDPDTSEQVAAGQRRWFDDFRKLPLIHDGGCMVVNIVFNPTTRRVEHAFCNGVA